MISGPSDFRHNISLTPSRTEMSKAEQSISKVPADGVKGKTWGPSSNAHSKQRPNIPEQTRWKTTSAPSLEKPVRPLVSQPSSVPDPLLRSGEGAGATTGCHSDSPLQHVQHACQRCCRLRRSAQQCVSHPPQAESK